jgi:3-deoxy-D-manno-octulosonic-acid transferase
VPIQNPKSKIQNGSGASRLLDLLYLGAGLLLIPYFIWRKIVKRKRSPGFFAKVGNIPARTAAGPRIWIHAVSVGEAQAAEPLVKALRQAIPNVDIVVSTTTMTGQSVAAKRYGTENVFYYPHDLSCCVKKALDRTQPAVLVLMELEVWPNMTAEAAGRGIPIVVANARITERSSPRYKRFWFLVGPSFKRVTRWLAQTEEYAARLRSLGVDAATIEVCGNIKYDAVQTNLPTQAERAKLRESLGLEENAPVLIGGSTHPSEEVSLLAAYKELRQRGSPGLRLILVPRHPERTANVVAEKGIKSCMEELRVGALDSRVILVNTVGELLSMYALSDVAFVGGSLIPHGGQNIMEPCGLGLPVVHGPHMHNFNDAMALLKSCDGSVEVSRENLTVALEKLFHDRTAAKAMAQRAREAFLKQQGASARTVEYVTKLLKSQ